MGVYQYDDPKTGQGYDLSIVGDVPTEEEFARLANKIRQDRTAFLEDYEQRFGTEIEFDDGTAHRSRFWSWYAADQASCR